MTYDETIDYLFTKLPMFEKTGASAFRKDLTNTIALCEAIGNPHIKFRSVHIAGTNGKGSVSHMLASVFQTAGYKTGLYTSPHLKDFRERIKVNGEMIAKDFVTNFTERIQPLIDKLKPSFFEITVAMAFDYFAKEKVDIAIIEVGLGGRLDSTNIITPELSVITNIGYDHMNMLGNTLEKIAFEKAGIIKPGVPVVIGEKNTALQSVFEKKAKELTAPIHFADERRFVAEWKMDKYELVAEVTQTHSNDKAYYHLDLMGIYQIKNLVTVLEALHLLQQQGWDITDTGIRKSLSQVKHLTGLHGRWEVIHNGPIVAMDVAHNEDGIFQLTRQIELTDHESLHIVIGMVKDKEIDKILSLLPKHANYYFTKAQIPRALPEYELWEKATRYGLHGVYYPDVNTAVQMAFAKAGKKDLIVICGSVFVVGEVNQYFNAPNFSKP
jgi:dihydrofolate synthase/folylpolyglutamate synthase